MRSLAKEENMPEIIFNQQQLVRVCQAAASAWHNRSLGLSGMMPPETNLCPPGIEYGSLNHALVLFFGGWCNRSGKTADQVIREAARLAIEFPETINPNISSHSLFFDAEIAGAIPFANKQIERIDWWRSCLALLKKKYKGDPRNIFLGIRPGRDKASLLQAREELIVRCSEFKGAKHKIAQLWIVWFQDVDWPSNKKQWQTIRTVPAVPVDLWVLRLMGQLGCIQSYRRDHRDVISRPVSDELVRICLDYGLSHGDLSQALWHVGARIDRWIPKRHPEKHARYCLNKCPLHDVCNAVVRADRSQTNRGSIGWGTALPRQKTLFKQVDL